MNKDIILKASRLSWLFLIPGIALLVVSPILYFKMISFEKNAKSTKGTVIELIERKSDGNPTFAPVFKFTDEAGVDIKVYSSLSSYPPPYSVGQIVNVLYNSNDSNDAIINDFMNKWFGSLATLLVGIITCLFAAGGALIGRWLGKNIAQQVDSAEAATND